MDLAERLQGRGHNYLPLLRDPSDNSPLTIHNQELVSKRQSYPFEDGILRLLTPEKRATFDAASAALTRERQANGWELANRETFKQLPQMGLSGWPNDYWQQRAYVTVAFWQVMEDARIAAGILPIGPMGTAVDLTGGMGWLGYGLDVSGYTSVVVGQNAGPYGLGIYPNSRYLPIQADLENLPLAPEAFDVVVFSFSLGGIQQPEQTLTKATRLLKETGHLIVMLDQQEGKDNRAQLAYDTLATARLQVEQKRIAPTGNALVKLAQTIRRSVAQLPPLIIGKR